MVKVGIKVPHVIYASQKGNAQAIAENIYEDLLKKGIKSNLSCISNINDPCKLQSYRCAIFIASTTGDGDPPDTACKFIRTLKNQISDKDKLQDVSYTVLGLGDSNYTNFCNFGKKLDEALQDLGGKRFYKCGWADDGTGLEIVVEPWIEGLFSTIQSFVTIGTPQTHPLIDKMIDASHSSADSSANDTSTPSPVKDTSIKRLAVVSSLLTDSDVITEDEVTSHPVLGCSFPDDAKLTLPPLPSGFLKVDIKEGDYCSSVITPTSNLPSSASDVMSCNLLSCNVLTSKTSSKKTLEVSFCLPSDSSFIYEPGDTFGIITQNCKREVDLLLYLLGFDELDNCFIEISVDPSSKKKSASLPSHLPSKASLRHIFTYCVEIRTIPKKPFLRALLDYTHDHLEKRRLMELVCKEGMQQYLKHVREGGLTFIDLLILFKSCNPPLKVILEHLPRLLPRPYSITSSPLQTPKEISFVFNVIDIKKQSSIAFSRKGICTGWLDQLTGNLQKSNSLEESFSGMTLEKLDQKIQIYFRTNSSFRLPKEPSVPIIMVGPGTGVAPFIGFLRHRYAQINKEAASIESMQSWLFFGCRRQSEDFLFEKELSFFEESGILKHSFVSFSREGIPGAPKYVQDNILLKGHELTELLYDTNAVIYVCGDARNMSKDVFETFSRILQTHKSLSETEARHFMAQLQLDKRYLQDVWA